jgi:hypothetical protein
VVSAAMQAGRQSEITVSAMCVFPSGKLTDLLAVHPWAHVINPSLLLCVKLGSVGDLLRLSGIVLERMSGAVDVDTAHVIVTMRVRGTRGGVPMAECGTCAVTTMSVPGANAAAGATDDATAARLVDDFETAVLVAGAVARGHVDVSLRRSRYMSLLKVRSNGECVCMCVLLVVPWVTRGVCVPTLVCRRC